MPDITYQDVLDKVIELGKSNPDFIYTAQPGIEYEHVCYYTGGNKKGEGRPCIVGQALIDLGISREYLEGFANEGASTFVPTVLEGSYHTDYAVLNRLERIQTRQDNGMPWGEAINVS